MSTVHPGGLEMLILFFILALPLLLLAGGVVLVLLALRHTGTAACRNAERALSAPEQDTMIKERREHCEKEEARIHELAANGKITEEESAELIHALHRETEYRACPFCSEDVRVEARKCPHCREYLVADVGNLKQRRLYRSRDRMLSGVCGGLANYIGMDPSLVRILVAVVTFFSGILTGLVIYTIMAWIIPEEPVGN